MAPLDDEGDDISDTQYSPAVRQNGNPWPANTNRPLFQRRPSQENPFALNAALVNGGLLQSPEIDDSSDEEDEEDNAGPDLTEEDRREHQHSMEERGDDHVDEMEMVRKWRIKYHKMPESDTTAASHLRSSSIDQPVLANFSIPNGIPRKPTGIVTNPLHVRPPTPIPSPPNGESFTAFGPSSQPSSSFVLPPPAETSSSTTTSPIAPLPFDFSSIQANSASVQASRKSRLERGAKSQQRGCDKGKGRESSGAGVGSDELARWEESNGSGSGFSIPSNFTFDFSLSSSEASLSNGLNSSSSVNSPSNPTQEAQPSTKDQPTFPNPAFFAPPPSLPSSSIPSTSIQASSYNSPRRPPLPPTTPISELPPPTPRPGHIAHVGPSMSAWQSGSNPAVPSPGLVTYRAPEELEQPSNSLGYFGSQGVPSQQADEGTQTEDPEKVLQDARDGTENHQNEGIPAGALPFDDEDFDEWAEQLEVNQPIGPPEVEDEDELELLQVAPEMPEAQRLDPADFEGLGDDDVEGAMEAVGMRGPLIVLFQNVRLSLFPIRFI